MYLIQIGHYEGSGKIVSSASTYGEAELLAKAEMWELDPFREWVHAYPESLEVSHFHVEFKSGFPYVYILTIPAF